jgi:hypothetical protein
MHVHGNQFNPNFQMNAIFAAARAEAKLAAERTRKKLMNAASMLEGDYEADYVVQLSEYSASHEDANQRNEQNQRGQTKSNGQASSESGGDPFSDWA